MLNNVIFIVFWTFAGHDFGYVDKHVDNCSFMWTNVDICRTRIL